VSGPIDTRQWVAQELRAGRDWMTREAHGLLRTNEPAWAEWWTTGWVTELVDATADTAGLAWDAWQRRGTP
jgi:hypothetical protein